MSCYWRNTLLDCGWNVRVTIKKKFFLDRIKKFQIRNCIFCVFRETHKSSVNFEIHFFSSFQNWKNFWDMTKKKYENWWELYFPYDNFVQHSVIIRENISLIHCMCVTCVVFFFTCFFIYVCMWLYSSDFEVYFYHVLKV